MVNRFLDHLEEWLITFLIGAATVIIFVAVVHRYLTGLVSGALQDALLAINLAWAQELTIFMFVWMAKFGAAYGVRTGIHPTSRRSRHANGPRSHAPALRLGTRRTVVGSDTFTGSRRHHGHPARTNGKRWIGFHEQCLGFGFPLALSPVGNTKAGRHSRLTDGCGVWVFGFLGFSAG